MFLLDAERNLEAARHFEIAAAAADNGGSEDAYETMFNAAVAYRQAGRTDRAEEFYRKALELRPDDPSAHLNLGACLHLVGKLEEAETHYLEAGRLNPGDDMTEINLGRLHNVMRKRGMKIRKPAEN